MASTVSAIAYAAFSLAPPDDTAYTVIDDSNYTIVASDSLIAYSALSAPRQVSLPATGSVPAGTQIVIKDESGNCSLSNTLNIVGIIDDATSVVLNSAYSNIRLYDNGTSWCKVSP